MRTGRRTRALHRAGERIESLVYGNGWAARIARGLGVQGKLRTTRGEVVLQRWPTDAPPLRIAFASDFHAGPLTHPELWERACAALERMGAELLLLGGDFVSLRGRQLDALAARLGRIPAPLGRFAVLGNHDIGVGRRRVTERLEAAGIRVLTNRNARLGPPWTHVWVCGLDDAGYGEPDASAALAGAEGVRIVIMHAPSGALDLRGERWDLALCGHTHGGQIALPGGRPVVVPHGPLSRRYARGRFHVGGGTLIVSRGIGCSGLPFRAFSDPEVLVCTVRGSARAPAESPPE